MASEFSEKNWEQTGSTKPTRKRRRIVISCTACHRRKQKCNRELPCSNCVSRNKEDACVYESTPLTKQASNSSRHEHRDLQQQADIDSAANGLSALGYSNAGGHNTLLGIVKKIENDGSTNLSAPPDSAPNHHEPRLREKYKGLVRQLPSRNYIDTLVTSFWKSCNWTYDYLDESLFMEQLRDWNSLSFAALNEGPNEVPKELRFFPGLLFQVLALALLFQPQNYDTSLDSLKYVTTMSLDDLASDYSESGAEILTLLGKNNLTLVAVQTGILRTSFFKNSGAITESWHSLSQTIRDAQEIGLHKDVAERTSSSPEKAIEALWMRELRRRTWMCLVFWALHMALVLGRPSALDIRDVRIWPLIDAPKPTDRRAVPPYPRSENDPPTSLTFFICLCHKIDTFREILLLENEGTCPRDYSKIEAIHEKVIRGWHDLPPYFRSANPDTTFDEHPDCHWLKASRPLIGTSCGFTLMSLHRPYVWTLVQSRNAALKACLQILTAQKDYFEYVQAHQYKMFNLVLSTFDAIVLVAAIYITYPTEYQEYLEETIQHILWGMERFETMSVRNQIAKSAQGVIQTIYARLMKALQKNGIKTGAILTSHTISATPSKLQCSESQSGEDGAPELSHNRDSMSSDNKSSASMSNYPSLPLYNPTNGDALDGPGMVKPYVYPEVPTSTPGVPSWGAFGNTLLPAYENNSFDFAAMAPLQPMADLLFNDLNGLLPPGEHTFQGSGEQLQFEGEFRNNSFWNYMNQYNP